MKGVPCKTKKCAPVLRFLLAMENYLGLFSCHVPTYVLKLLIGYRPWESMLSTEVLCARINTEHSILEYN